MTDKEWMQIADVALQAAILTLRKNSPQSERDAVADYCESIKDQRPKEG